MTVDVALWLVCVHLAAVLAMPILLVGIINRTKSLWAGRKGPGLLQSGWDLLRLLRKRPVYSAVATPLFRAGAWVVLAAAVLAALIAPVLGSFAPLQFNHDFIVFAYTLGLARLFILLQAEASRVPVDDPLTHLELTMVHEVMVLDHSGPDLAAMQFAGALKLSTYAGLIAALLNPFDPAVAPLAAVATALAIMALVAVAVGFVESLSARLRLRLVPRYLMLASVGAGLCLAVVASAWGI